MAVESTTNAPVSQASGVRRFLVGTNVVVAVILVVAIIVVVQVIAYRVPLRWDMTSSGVNSLSEGTENLLRILDTNVRLTSLYFETDREDEDQPKYRRSAQDLLDLYEAMNRGKVTSEWINPLKDHEKISALLTRLAEKSVFRDEIAAYRERLDLYTDELDGRMEKELEKLAGIGGPMGSDSQEAALAPVEQLMSRLSRTLESTREQVDTSSLGEQPQYSVAKNVLQGLYRQISKALKDVSQFGKEQVQRNPNLTADEADFLRNAGTRYADLVAAIEEEMSELQELDPLKFDELTAQLQPTSNPILVETQDDARVVGFRSVWPPVQERGGSRAGFAQRAFKGEEKLTSAILRTTHKEQTGVVFVRYGGSPLFLGGFMPGQPPAPYTAMKQQLEDANFIVEEWDLKASQTPPEIDPKPTRTIYVVEKPTAPQRGPMGQPGLDAPFGPNHRDAILGAIGEAGRALFLTGWYPGPFGPIAGDYEYGKYLDDEWGIKVETSELLMQAVSIAPEKYGATQAFYLMAEPELSDHDIVSSAASRELALPWCAPLIVDPQPPDGVALDRIVSLPRRDGLWGVKNIQEYQEQITQREYLTKVADDSEGPFALAVAATKGDAKIVVVSSRGFAQDSVAFAREFVLSGNSVGFRMRNPGNILLLINSLHWLNDNSEFMNIGKPIDAAVLEIKSPGTVKAVQALAIFAWPLFAMVAGGAVWWVRRK